MGRSEGEGPTYEERGTKAAEGRGREFPAKPR